MNGRSTIRRSVSAVWPQGAARCLWLIAFCACVHALASGMLLAAEPVAVVPRGLAPPAAKPEPRDQSDVLLMLDGGPLHLRLHLALGGVSMAQARRQYVTRLMESLDTNKDGKLSRTEAAGSPILRTKQRPGAAQFLESLGGQSDLTPRDVAQKVDVRGGGLVAFREELSSSKNDTEVFKLLDVNGSGALEGEELAAAGELVMSKDTDSDECVSFQEFFPPPPPPDPMQVAIGMVAPPTVTGATIADMIRDASHIDTPARLIKKYDRNRDRRLARDEINWSKERLAALDVDGNEFLDLAELADVRTGEPDAELSVDLHSAESQGGVLAIDRAAGQRLDDAGRLDYAKVAFEPAVVTFSHRNLDPVVSAVESALRQFNLLDADANGYLGRDEISMRIRFERGLFELMDSDGDDKVFADEMKQYVQVMAEPAAMTCRIMLYDTGYGFFMALDANADGRISVREMRRAAGSLGQLERDGKPGVSEKEPVRHFHVEFVRGSYQLFGPSEQLVVDAPAFQQRKASGPIWFQRMDRNNDGDLTWNEFLGPREVFHSLDSDLDSLVDPQEAVKAR